MNLDPPVAATVGPSVAEAPRRIVLRILLILLSLAGVVLCGILIAIRASGGQGWASQLCSPTSGFDCSHALHSQWSNIWIFSAAELGAAYFGLHLVWYLFIGIPNREGRLWQLLIVLIGLVGIAASFYYSAIMIFRLPTLCQYCIAVHVANTLLVALGIVAFFRSPDSGRTPIPTNKTALATFGLAAAVALFFVIAAAGFKNQQAAFRFQSLYLETVNDIDYIVWKHASAERHEIPNNERDFAIGDTHADHTLVVFTDFECGECERFHNNVFPMVNGFDGAIRVVFKHYPVARACNPYINRDFHFYSCDAARAAIAAGAVAEPEKTRKFWESIFAISQSLDINPYYPIAKGIGINLSDFEEARRDQKTTQQLEGDIELAHSLGVEGTPTFFLDGRRLIRWNMVTNEVSPRPDKANTIRLWEKLLGASFKTESKKSEQ